MYCKNPSSLCQIKSNQSKTQETLKNCILLLAHNLKGPKIWKEVQHLYQLRNKKKNLIQIIKFGHKCKRDDKIAPRRCAILLSRISQDFKSSKFLLHYFYIFSQLRNSQVKQAATTCWEHPSKQFFDNKNIYLKCYLRTYAFTSIIVQKILESDTKKILRTLNFNFIL